METPEQVQAGWKVGSTQYRYTLVQVELLWEILQKQSRRSFHKALVTFADVLNVSKPDLLDFWLPLAEQLVCYDSVKAFWDRDKF